MTAPVFIDAFWSAVDEGVLQFQVCDECGFTRWPPSGVCPECLSREWSWRPSRGEGSVWSYVVYHRAYDAEFGPWLPYNVALIELDEGVRLLSRIVDVDYPGGISVGCRVRVTFRPLGGTRAVAVFVPVDTVQDSVPGEAPGTEGER
jgi:uncharacterized OB-fold protein